MSIEDITRQARELSLAELKTLPEKIALMIAEREKAEKDQVRAELEAMAKAKGFVAADLFGKAPAEKGKSKAPAKYRNPNDPTQTYTGRGRKPKWLEDALEKGMQLEDFAV